MAGGTDKKVERDAMEALEDALQQPSATRQDYIKKRKDLSAQVRHRAMQLLRYEELTEKSLQTGSAGKNLDSEDAPPDQIGAYRILRLIGRGGMGNVYLAERASNDFDHVAAIKLIKKQLTTPEVLERFRRERQILANLNHPNIAQLFDGGETEEGAPYFVMEYINGQPIHHWLKMQKPNQDTVLNAFIQICSAVAFAHQNLIIHRDLTPPNILISEDGQVKLIDFGIAKPGTVSDVEDESSGLSFTPGFAAPERQAGGATILSDIYSLGKLLDLLVARFCDEELGAVIRKATAEKPEDRYQNAEAIRTDIQNYLENRPVSALGNAPLYALKKFASRQKLLVGSTALLSVGIVISLIIALLAYQQEGIARAEAEKRFSDVRSLANSMMFDIYDEISTVPGSSEAEIKLAEAAQKYLNGLAVDDSNDPELQLETARGFFRLARIQGNPSAGTRKRIKEAKANYQAAEKILVPLLEADPANQEARYELNRIYYDQGDMALFNDHDTKAGFTALQKAKKVVEDGKQFGPLSKDLRQALISIKSLTSIAHARDSENDKALELSLEVKDENLSLAKDFPDDDPLQRQVAIGLNNLGRQMINMDEHAAARDAYSEALEVVSSLIKKDPENDLYQRDMAYTHWRRAHAYARLKNGRLSLQDFEAANEYMEQLLRDDPKNDNNTTFAYVIRGEAMLAHKHLGDYRTAEKVGLQYVEDTLQFAKKHPADKNIVRDTMVAYQNLATLYEEWSRLREQCEMLSRLFAHTNKMMRDGILSERDKQGLADFKSARSKC